MFGLLLACSTGSALQGMPAGEWAIEGDEYSGSLRVEAESCEIELWGPTLQAGDDTVPCHSVREEKGFGLHFGVQMGVGEATAYARIDEDLQSFVLPLGSREGDFEHRLRLVSGSLSSGDRTASRQKAALGLEESRRLWEKSVFQLRSQGELVGELFFPSRGAPEIQLYSAFWMTRGRVESELVERGPDLWLSFEIMPSLQSEQGLLLVNRAENKAVFPMGQTPVPGEIVLELAGGTVAESERVQSIEVALHEGLVIERAITEPVTMGTGTTETLWAELEAGGCRSWSDLSSEKKEMGLALQGYSVDIRQPPESCRLLVEPRPVQQGRRLAFRAEAGGELEVVERKFFTEVPRNF